MESKSRGRSWSASSTTTTLTLTLSRTTTMLIKISQTTVAATRRRIAAPKSRHTGNDQREERPLRRRRRSKVDLEVERVSLLLTRRIKTKHAAARKAKEDLQKALANENKSERIQLFFQRKSWPHSWDMTQTHRVVNTQLFDQHRKATETRVLLYQRECQCSFCAAAQERHPQVSADALNGGHLSTGSTTVQCLTVICCTCHITPT